MLSAMLKDYHDRVGKVQNEKGEEAAKKYADGEGKRYLKANARPLRGFFTGDSQAL